MSSLGGAGGVTWCQISRPRTPSSPADLGLWNRVCFLGGVRLKAQLCAVSAEGLSVRGPGPRGRLLRRSMCFLGKQPLLSRRRHSIILN